MSIRDSRFVRNTVYLVGSSALQAALGMGTNLLLVRLLEPEAFGRYVIISAAASMTLAIASIRVGTLIIREQANGLDGARRELYCNIVLQECVLALLVGVAVLGYSSTLRLSTLLLLGAIVTNHFFNNIKAFFERGMDYSRLALLETFAFIAANVSSVGLAFWLRDERALYARDVIVAASSIYGLVRLGGWPAFRLRLVRWSEWVSTVRASKDVCLDGLLESTYGRIAVLCTAALAGERGAGLCSQAQRLAVVPHQLLNPIAGRLMVNVIAREEGQEGSPALSRTAKQILVWMIASLSVVVLGVVLLADRVVPLVLGARWAEVTPLLVTMIGVILFTSPGELLKSHFFARRMFNGVVVFRAAMFLGLGVGMMPLLGRWMTGEMRAALGISLAFTFSFAAGLVLVSRHSHQPAAVKHEQDALSQVSGAP